MDKLNRFADGYNRAVTDWQRGQPKAADAK
jgi:hypothetical protein